MWGYVFDIQLIESQGQYTGIMIHQFDRSWVRSSGFDFDEGAFSSVFGGEGFRCRDGLVEIGAISKSDIFGLDSAADASRDKSKGPVDKTRMSNDMT